MTDTDFIRDEIMEHMARAFFASAWADYEEEYGDANLSGVDVMDVMPDGIDPAATAAAESLAADLEKMHGRGLPEIFAAAKCVSRRHRDGGDRKRTAEMFGHYAAMGAMGHGVSLYDALGRKAAEYVNTSACYREFSYLDLDEAKYPIPAEAV